MVKSETYGVEKNILVAPELALTFGARVTNTGVDADANGKKILKAGTPLAGNLLARNTAFTKATVTDTGTKGVYTIQITTAASVGDKLTIEGETYECAAAEDVAGKKFAGANAAAQVTSLLKMVVCEDFVVSSVSDATDKIKFTQKVAETGNVPTKSVTQAAENGSLVVGDVTTVTAGSTGSLSSNAVCVLLHDVDVTAGAENGTIVVEGCIDLLKLADDVYDLVNVDAVYAKLNKITFIKGANR